jgi:hypothetical protein
MIEQPEGVWHVEGMVRDCQWAGRQHVAWRPGACDGDTAAHEMKAAVG